MTRYHFTTWWSLRGLHDLIGWAQYLLPGRFTLSVA